MLNTEKILLEAIFGACCNEPTSPAYIKEFICDGFVKAGYVEPDEVTTLEDIVDTIIKQLKRDGLLSSEYYFEGEFHVTATDRFARTLNYTVEEVGLC